MIRVQWPIEEMIRWYQEESMTCDEVAGRLVEQGWEAKWLEMHGITCTPTSKNVQRVLRRAGCAMRGRGAPMEKNCFWKGGRHVDRFGYVSVKVPGHPGATKAGYVREHRLIAEKILGRYLTDTEVVHHKDEDPSNNDPSNLLVYETNGKHLAETLVGISCPARGRKMAWDDATLARWQADGLTTIEIGLLLNRSAEAVRAHLRDIGVAIPNRGGCTVAKGRKSKVQEHHRLEASQLDAKFRGDPRFGGRQNPRTKGRSTTKPEIVA